MYSRGMGDANTTACIATCTQYAPSGSYQDCITGCCAQYPTDNICANAGGTQSPSFLCQTLGYGCDVPLTPPGTSAACAANPLSIACSLENFGTGAGLGLLVMAGFALLLISAAVRR